MHAPDPWFGALLFRQLGRENLQEIFRKQGAVCPLAALRLTPEDICEQKKPSRQSKTPALRQVFWRAIHRRRDADIRYTRHIRDRATLCRKTGRDGAGLCVERRRGGGSKAGLVVM